MGSGELTATMVEVHKEVIAALPHRPQPVFLDTPAGFQLNVDQLSHKAVDYFRRHVQQRMSVASFKSNDTVAPYEAEQAFHTLRTGNYILIGPGSPTYAVRQWQQTPIPKILTNRVESGGCLVAASAAALTVGRLTLPVYEIYKVGEVPHWVEGLNILGDFGFNLVIIPHWNNAEGGTHDTRFCYMGETRFKQLESILPKDMSILGLDEHTACIMDFKKDEAVIKGLGRVTLRRHGAELAFEKGNRIPLDILRGEAVGQEWTFTPREPATDEQATAQEEQPFWERIHRIEESFHASLEKNESREMTNALLDLDRAIWAAKQDLESEEFIAQAREILRELIVLVGTVLESRPRDKAGCLAPLVEDLIGLREECRRKKQWKSADAIRDILQRSGVTIEDTRNGPLWQLDEERS